MRSGIRQITGGIELPNKKSESSKKRKTTSTCLFVCLFVFGGISTFVGDLMQNPFLYK